MSRKVLNHLRAQWAGFLALFLAIAGGTAYAVDTVGSADVIDNSLTSNDLKNNQGVKSADVQNESLSSVDIDDGSVGGWDVDDETLTGDDVADDTLTGRDIANPSLTGDDIVDQSGVDTCIASVRLGSLCVRAENSARTWKGALAHCANLGLRVPTIGEALQLAQTHDIPNADELEFFWTDEMFRRELPDGSLGDQALLVDDSGRTAPTFQSGSWETVCVMTPTN